MGHGMFVQRVELVNTISLLRQSLLFLLSSLKIELRNVSYKMFSSAVSVTYFDGKLLKREDEKDLTQDG